MVDTQPLMRYTNPGAFGSMLIEENHEYSDSIRNEKLKVSEIFTSLQGEGLYLGTPAVFLRLAVCNMHCWYCDTKYTWLYNARVLETIKSDIRRLGVQAPTDLKIYDSGKEIKEMTVEDMERELCASNQNHLVLTGGEPMLQQRTLIPLLRKLKEQRDFFIEVETSGTVKPGLEILPWVDQWNVSPKLESSGNSQMREKPEVLGLFGKLPNTIFKFVVQSLTDLEEIKLLVKRYEIANSRVMLMPEGTETRILNERTAWLLKACDDMGYRYSTRLHILIWGNKRGV